jgi:integrase
MKDIVSVAFRTGFRKTNIRLLKWSSLNFHFKFIEIPANSFKGGKKHTIPMTKELEEIFRRNWNETEYVFINPERQKPYTDENISDAFKDGCEKAGIDTGKRFHDIRHTVATRLLENGEDIITVKELLGNSTVAVTEKYTHTNINKKRDALTKLYSYG